MSFLRAISLLLTLALTSCTAAPRQAGPEEVGATGLTLLAIQLTAGGDIVRLNYQVADVERARQTLTGEILLRAGEEGPWLKVTSAGRLGPMKQRPAPGHKRQFILFTNSGRTLVRGDTAILYSGGEPIARIPVT